MSTMDQEPEDWREDVRKQLIAEDAQQDEGMLLLREVMFWFFLFIFLGVLWFLVGYPFVS